MVPAVAVYFYLRNCVESVVQRHLRAEDAEFADEIADFVEQFWPQPEIVLQAHRDRWRDALLSRGWSVPSWPRALGGQDWTDMQQYLWFRTCRQAGVPSEWDAGTTLVGPALFHQDTHFAQQRLAEIVQLRQRWCVAQHGLSVTQAQRSDSGWTLQGEKSGVIDGNDADWMLLQAQLDDATDGWFCVSTTAAGVELGPPHSLDGQLCSVIKLNQVNVSAAAYVPAVQWSDGPFDGLSGLLQRFAGAVEGQLDASPVASEVQIALAGLQAMEARWLAARQQGQPLPFPAAVLRLKGEEIFTQLGDLLIDSFGYYALPDVDAALSHNAPPLQPEGPPEGSQRLAQLGGVRRMLGQIMARSGQLDPLLRDQIAQSLWQGDAGDQR